MHVSRPHPTNNEGLLYPLMWICAIAVIIFSVLGMISMAGWIPRSGIGNASSVVPQRELTTSAQAVNPGDKSGSQIEQAARAFQCAECGIIDSIRDKERGNTQSTPTATLDATSRLER